MIIVGYQGIGKSSTANPENKCIDLESGNFFVDGIRPDDWYKYYVKIAQHLSEQGYIVFVSSHQVVRDELAAVNAKDVAICYPLFALKNKWIQRLEDRYNRTKLEKDYKALMNAKESYDDNIINILVSADVNRWKKIAINSVDYKLIDILNSTLNNE